MRFCIHGLRVALLCAAFCGAVTGIRAAVEPSRNAVDLASPRPQPDQADGAATNPAAAPIPPPYHPTARWHWEIGEAGRYLDLPAVMVVALLGWALLLWREAGRQRELNRQLEARIAERTAALTATKERLEREIALQRRAERIRQAIYQISEAIHATEDLESLYLRIHEIVRELTGARNFYIATYDAAADRLSFPYYIDEKDPVPTPRPPGRGFTEYVLRSGRSLLANAEVTAELVRNGTCAPLGSRAALWLGVPLRTRARTFGVLAVQEYTNTDAFGTEEKGVLEFVAEQVAIALDRRRAMDEVLESQSRLRESEERFSKGFQSSAGSLSILSLDTGRYLDVNEGFTRTYGYPREAVLNRTPVEIGLWTDLKRPRALERQVRETGMFRNEESVVRCSDGRLITIIASGDRIEIGGRPYVVTSALDITDRKRAEAELVNALQRERELSRLKSSFVSLVSHEFRTPLGVILSSSEILERYLDRLTPQQRTQQFQSISSAVSHMSKMMNEVLLLGRFDAGRVEFHPTPMDLAVFCRRLVEELGMATQQRCPIDLQVSGRLEGVVADEYLLGHILNNLLSNAVKYSPAGAQVELLVHHENGRLTFVVRDRGCGIPEADRGRLFSAFQRGSNVGVVTGTGLGLVIVRRCAELHGGTVAFAARDGGGTIFTVELPSGASALLDTSSTTKPA